MATNTTNYNLMKPAYSDTADIADINGNMDIIDAQMKTNANGISALNSKVTVLENKTRYAQGLTGEITTSLAYLTGQVELPAGIYIIFASLGLQSYKAVKEIRIYSSTDDFATSNLEIFSYGPLTIIFTKITETTKFKVQASSVESDSSIVADSRLSCIRAIKVS